jgi:hypothetical protein
MTGEGRVEGEHAERPMIDVFISYAREDRQQAAELAQLLEKHGYEVWWDWRLVGGTKYREIINGKLKEARKVIVLWSANSINSSFVIDEAQEAKDNGKLVPISIDASRPPMGFRDVHTLAVNKFQALTEAIVAAIEDRAPRETLPPQAFLMKNPAAGRKGVGRYAVYGTLVIACVALGILAARFLFDRGSTAVEPVYTIYKSAELGVTLLFPNNILSLDTTERLERRLSIRDGQGRPVIRITRTPLAGERDVKVARRNEVDQLKKLNFTITYIAPEKEANWKDWYVVSGVSNDTKIYYRRWFCTDSIVSMEFVFPSAMTPLFEKLIPTMTREFSYDAAAPRITP